LRTVRHQGRDFLPLMREELDIALRIIEILCSKPRRTTAQADEVMFLNLPSRLAKALMRLVDPDTTGKEEPKVSATQRDLGNMIGMSRESTNKLAHLGSKEVGAPECVLGALRS
jgi:hypothetical protein